MTNIIQISIQDRLHDIERGQMYEQARLLARRFTGRERQNISGVFYSLAASALLSRGWTVPRQATSVVPTDPTAPDDHLKDDIGTTMAFIRELESDEWTLPGVKQAWHEVQMELAAFRNRGFEPRSD